MGLGERIKHIRGECPRDKFASLLGVSRNSIANYEAEVRAPDSNFLTKLLATYSEIVLPGFSLVMAP